MTADRNLSYRGNPDFVDSDHKTGQRKIKMTPTLFLWAPFFLVGEGRGTE